VRPCNRWIAPQFYQATRAAGLDASAVISATAYTQEAGKTAAAMLLDRFPDVTAVAAGNDLLALGLY
jgi:LacI family transcriptional regulator